MRLAEHNERCIAVRLLCLSSDSSIRCIDLDNVFNIIHIVALLHRLIRSITNLTTSRASGRLANPNAIMINRLPSDPGNRVQMLRRGYLSDNFASGACEQQRIADAFHPGADPAAPGADRRFLGLAAGLIPCLEEGEGRGLV
jgi:hypothetical protein